MHEREIICIENGSLVSNLLGSAPDNYENFQIVVPKNTWFAASLKNKNGFALAGCTVSPGFHFDDFEMADEKLLNEYPQLEKQIRMLVRNQQ